MKVLIVEGNTAILRLLDLLLHRENFTTDHATDGQVAFDKIKQNRYDLILLDIVLPNRSGLFIISAIRALGIETPVLAMSTNDSVGLRVNALNMGADDFLVKEFANEELLARCKNLFRRGAKKRTNILKNKDVVVNLSNMTAQIKEKNLVLTKKEFQILVLLLRNKGRVVTKKDMMLALWGNPENIKLSNVINVHIKSLRDKIGIENFIETVRSTGYIIRT